MKHYVVKKGCFYLHKDGVLPVWSNLADAIRYVCPLTAEFVAGHENGYAIDYDVAAHETRLVENKFHE